MKKIVVTPSFNHKVIKTLTKEQFLEQHPDHGHVWDEINEVSKETEKQEKPKKKNEA